MSDGAASGWIYYVDESYDENRFCLTGLGLKIATWREAFDAVKEYRKQLKQTDGVLLRTELHARDLVSGRGSLGSRVVGKWRRSRIFYELLELIASLPDVHIFNICLEQSGRRDAQLDAWDRLLNRINRTCEERNRQENSLRRQLIAAVGSVVANARTVQDIERRLIPYGAHALLVADEGHETEIVRLKRKLTVVNFVPSRFGSWGDSRSKNIPLKHFVEDTLFRDSAHSYLIQLADCAAFALLKRETEPTPLVKKYALHKAFDAYLQSVCYRKAAQYDADGIVRK